MRQVNPRCDEYYLISGLMRIVSQLDGESQDMNLIYNPVFKQHDTGMHPETSKRLDALGDLPVTVLEYDESVLEVIHTRPYIEKVREYCSRGMPLDGDTHTSVGSFEAAVYAANATVKAARQNDFAIVRPPGHHACPDHASGFCLFNNIAIAAQLLVNEGKKVLIFDFDGHLGDGTMKAFYDSSQVMYWSIHQYPAFPGFGTENEIGEGDGTGFTINVPVPPGAGDDIYMDALQYTLPIAKQFKPDVVAVSAGFDSHQYDLLLELRYTVDSFYDTGRMLSDNFSHVFATLEGGYNIQTLAQCMLNFLDGINGAEKRYTERHTDSDIKVWGEYELRFDKLLGNLLPFWSI